MRRSPQEKKALSYAKDRRNAYGESDKASRRLIPLRKAKVNRANRHADHLTLSSATGPVDPLIAEASELRVAGHRRKSWRKHPDESLRVRVQRQHQLRQHYGETGGRRANLRSSDRVAGGVNSEPATVERSLGGAWVQPVGRERRTWIAATDTALYFPGQWPPGRWPLDKVAVMTAGSTLTVVMFDGRRAEFDIAADHPLVQGLMVAMNSRGRRHPWWVDSALLDSESPDGPTGNTAEGSSPGCPAPAPSSPACDIGDRRTPESSGPAQNLHKIRAR